MYVRVHQFVFFWDHKGDLDNFPMELRSFVGSFADDEAYIKEIHAYGAVNINTKDVASRWCSSARIFSIDDHHNVEHVLQGLLIAACRSSDPIDI